MRVTQVSPRIGAWYLYHTGGSIGQVETKQDLEGMQFAIKDGSVDFFATRAEAEQSKAAYVRLGTYEKGPCGKTVLHALKDASIVDIEPTPEGFCVTEECDGYFSVTLTKDQMLLLIAELSAMVHAEKG